MPKYRRVAYISRAKGLSGEVVVASVHDLSSRIDVGDKLWVVPPDHDLIRATIVVSQSLEPDQSNQVIKLQGVEDRTTAQRLVGRSLLGLAEDFEWACEGEDDGAVGSTIIDAAGNLIGVVTEERLGSAQTLWVVDGPTGELLIPAVEEFILAREAKTITMSLPQGLLELNQKHDTD